ncbi:MAG: pseudouridine synthase [Thermodesulfobacteriota bacterium]
MLRLQKIIAHAGLTSRRKAEQLIKEGKVRVDGKIVNQPGTKADPDRQKITVNDRPLESNPEKICLLLNKPRGYVTTMNDPQGRPTVISLLKGIKQRVFPVGRLDLETSGALLLTNDGDLANKIIHPRYNVKKTYIARVSGSPSKTALKKLTEGVEIEGRLTAAAQLQSIKSSRHSSVLKIIIHEGRKRQIRKMFAIMGHPVLDLTRIAYGNLKLGDLPRGEYRFINEKELPRIFQKNST